MAYRDESEPLKERHESLSRALEQVRAHSRALADEEAALSEELERVNERLLDGAIPKQRSRSFMVAMVSAGGSALLAFAALGRIMTSEIAPFQMHSQQPTHAALSITVKGAGDATNSATTPLDLDDDENASLGYLRVDAPKGSRIFEGGELLGTAPLIHPMPVGTHAIRLVPDRGPARIKLGVVRSHGIGTVRFD